MDALRMLSKGPGNSDYEAEVERLLSCPICLEVYSKPVVILPCQHNLCRKCANDVFQNRGTPMGSGGRFRCPTCRYEVMLDRHGVYGLQRNLLVENIIDMYQSESKKPFRKLEVLMCEEHEEEKVNIFCVTCQKPTCSLCKVFGQHKDCTVSPVDKVYKDHKTEISGAIAMLVAGNDRLQQIISKTEDLVSKTEENSKMKQADLCAAFDKLYSVLEDRKQSMLSRIKSVTQEKNEALQEMLRQYGSQLEKSSKLVEEALSLLEEPNAAQFLSVSRELINKVTSSARATEVKKPPSNIHELDMFEVDFSQPTAELSVLNFIGADDVEIAADEGENANCDVSADADLAPSSSGGSFRAKLLLPQPDGAAEVVASAEVTRKKSEDESDETTSFGSHSDCGSNAMGRRESETSLDSSHLDSDVKAIAERYLADRASRPGSQASRRSGSAASGDSRRRSYSEENSKLAALEQRFRKLTNNRSSPEPRDLSPEPGTHPQTWTVTNFTPTGISEHGEVEPRRSDSPARSQERGRPTRQISSSIERRNGTFIPQVQSQFEFSSGMSPQRLESTVPQRARRTERRLPRTYTTHRRRTWSHLLDKK